jgi:hypothetical protein
MKMVLVYDTDNVEDYQNSIAIMRKLVNDYDARYRGAHREFGRIEFIKVLRQWEKVAAESEKNRDGIASLKTVKQFADNIWRENK